MVVFTSPPAPTAITPTLFEQLLYPQVPWPLNYIPSICRLLATLIISPAILILLVDVGGYLLFKVFYKPFGEYPKYSYFKQSTKEPFHASSKSASPSPTVSTIPLITTSDDDSPSNSTFELRQRPKKSATRHAEDDMEFIPAGASNGLGKGLPPRVRLGSSEQRVRAQSVGFEGPMLEEADLRSPSGSEYGGDQSEDNDTPQSSRETSPFVERRGFAMTPVTRIAE